MSKISPSPDYDRRLFAVGDCIASGSLRMVDRPRALRWAYLACLFGACGILLGRFGPAFEWSYFPLAAAATARVAHLLIDKNTWVVRPSPNEVQSNPMGRSATMHQRVAGLRANELTATGRDAADKSESNK